MPQTLNEKDKRAVATILNELLDEHLTRFPYAKYPTEPLEEWKRIFCDPKSIPAETLRQALGWQFGGWQRKDLAFAQRRTIAEIVKAWPEFAETAALEPRQAFSFWQDKLTDWHHGFDAAAFLLHLLRPDAFENVDRHRLGAMSELLEATGREAEGLTNPHSLTDIQNYTSIFRVLVPKLPYGDDSHIKLDRFLKVYGNRHAYKRVPLDFATREPTIRTFSWVSTVSKRFRLDQITSRANADMLFACLLLTLEAENRSHEDLTIGEVIERLPLGTGGLCNPASFNYALVALFGGQRQRDYWIFDRPELRHSFTEQANQSTRNMRYYLAHATEKLSVNPKYVNGDD